MRRLIGWVCVLNLLLTGFPGMAKEATQEPPQVSFKGHETSQEDAALLLRKDKKEVEGCRKDLCRLPPSGTPGSLQFQINSSVKADDKQTSEVKGDERQNSRSERMKHLIEFFENNSHAKKTSSESSPQLARSFVHPQLFQPQNVPNTRTNDRSEIKTLEAPIFQKQDSEMSEETGESWPPPPSLAELAAMETAAGQEERDAQPDEPLANPGTLPPPQPDLAEALRQALEERKNLMQNATHRPESNESETDDEDDESEWDDTGTAYDTESEWDNESEGEDDELAEGDDSGLLFDKERGEYYSTLNGVKQYWDGTKQQWYIEENENKLYYHEDRQEWVSDRPTASSQNLSESIADVKLRKVAPDLNQKPVDPRKEHLQNIREGIRLKKVDLNTPHPSQKLKIETVAKQDEEQKNPVSPSSDLGKALLNAIQNDSTESSGAEEKDEDDDEVDDGDWGDDPESLQAAVAKKIEEDEKHATFIKREAAKRIQQENGNNQVKTSNSSPEKKSKVHTSEEEENPGQTVTQGLSFFRQLENLSPAEQKAAREAHRKAWLEPKEVIIEESQGILFATEQDGACVVHHGDSPTPSASQNDNFGEVRSKGSSGSQNSELSEGPTHSDVAYIDSVAAEYDSHEVAVIESQHYDDAIAAYYTGEAATATVSETDTSPPEAQHDMLVAPGV